MDLKKHKQKLLKEKPEFKKEYYSYDLDFEIGQMILEARSRLGVTQKQLAEVINTKQSGIARAESGNYLPSLSFLSKVARALKTKLIVKFGFMSNYLSEAETISSEKSFVSTNMEDSFPYSNPTYSTRNYEESKLQDYHFKT